MSRKDIQGICILIFVASVIVGLFALWNAISASTKNIDPETLCRIGHNDPITKVLIDKTDTWNGHGQERLASLIRTFKSQLAQHERLSIYVLDETGTYSPSPLFDMCNPGRGDQANELYQNPRLTQKTFEEQFAQPLDKLMNDLLQPGTAPRSPLIETMKELRGEDAQERLVLISDMMQNSEELSFYGQNQARLQGGKEEICSMVNPYQSIEVYYINRSGISVSQKQQSRNFWTSFLKKAAWSSTWDTL